MFDLVMFELCDVRYILGLEMSFQKFQVCCVTKFDDVFTSQNSDTKFRDVSKFPPTSQSLVMYDKINCVMYTFS